MVRSIRHDEIERLVREVEAGRTLVVPSRGPLGAPGAGTAESGHGTAMMIRADSPLWNVLLAAKVEPGEDQINTQAHMLGFLARFGGLVLLAARLGLGPRESTALGVAQALGALPGPGIPDDEIAFREAVADGLLKATDPELRTAVGLFLASPEKEILLHFAARWTQNAFPVVEIGSRLAASLMATSMTGLDASMLRPPWSAFAVRVPPGLIALRRGDGSRDEIHTLTVVTAPGPEPEDPVKWAIYAHGAYVEAWTRGYTSAELMADLDAGENCDADQPYNAGLDSEDDRTLLLCRRLVRSLAIWLGDSERRAESKQPAPSRKAMRARQRRERGHKPISFDRYVIKAPVTVDCRPHLEKYVAGESRSLTVRSVVRGHFKPRLGARLGRVVWVEPYTRGPDGAPFAVRVHLAKDEP